MPQEFFQQAKLDVPRLRDLLGPLFATNDAAERWDQALRITRLALSFIDPAAADTREADPSVVAGLALVYPVRVKVVPTLRVRASVEAYFVSQGWTALRSRELMRGLERLPDKPQTVDEKIVADAENLTRLGVLGACRAAMAAGAAEQTLEQLAEQLNKNIHRRMFTRAGQTHGVTARDEVRDFATKLRKALEVEG